ncbi:uncharacterized protein PRCAT00001930001 [Priceomyces carsonii]|uniref:uncharacterized protein n=1 Tax=Priceomyces carsonii TaxID=28549 RepID=UPI002EDA3A31|nr:unnamed protein product [Priceomyces carsonii]
MGSKRKRAEKQKDFTKAKLKVGKTAAKPDNYTDTSFKSRTISLPNQSISKKIKSGQSNQSEDHELIKYLSLTKHHSASTRREVLHYIETHLPSGPSMYKQIISNITPLFLDSSLEVRKGAVSLLSACAESQPGLLDLHLRPIILFIHSAMTHIQSDIRNSSTKFLLVLISKAGDSLAKGYFIKTMKAFFILLSWSLDESKKSVSLAASSVNSLGGATKRARTQHLAAFKLFLKVCFFSNEDECAVDLAKIVQVHPQSYKYLLPHAPQPYSPLKLFNRHIINSNIIGSFSNEQNSDSSAYSLADLNVVSTEDLDTRRKVMLDAFLCPLETNLKKLIKEGGDVGREANTCLELIDEISKDSKSSINN